MLICCNLRKVRARLESLCLTKVRIPISRNTRSDYGVQRRTLGKRGKEREIVWTRPTPEQQPGRSLSPGSLLRPISPLQLLVSSRDANCGWVCYLRTFLAFARPSIFTRHDVKMEGTEKGTPRVHEYTHFIREGGFSRGFAKGEAAGHSASVSDWYG